MIINQFEAAVHFMDAGGHSCEDRALYEVIYDEQDSPKMAVTYYVYRLPAVEYVSPADNSQTGNERGKL